MSDSLELRVEELEKNLQEVKDELQMSHRRFEGLGGSARLEVIESILEKFVGTEDAEYSENAKRFIGNRLRRSGYKTDWV